MDDKCRCRGEPVAYTTRTGMKDGRLSPRPFQFGDTLPAVGSYCLVSGANCDIESDQHRGYSWRQVLGYSDDKEFVCLQTHKDSYACWPTVERLTNCWFAEIPHPIHPSSQPRQQARGEPVAEVYSHKSRDMMRVTTTNVRLLKSVPDGTKLYAAPQPQQSCEPVAIRVREKIYLGTENGWTYHSPFVPKSNGQKKH